MEDVILRRGSTRVMRREPVPGAVLDDVMAAGAASVPGDWPPLVRSYVSVHGAGGIEPGTYRWSGGHLEPIQVRAEDEARAAAEHLCLDQPLGGDSAFTVFHAADLDRVLDTLGPRGYRAAHLEAGIAAGRIQLAAASAGIGSTGLTFYDDEVRAHFGTDDACLLVTSVGVPDYRPRKGGGPGRPTDLPGFQSLMLRLSRRLRPR